MIERVTKGIGGWNETLVRVQGSWSGFLLDESGQDQIEYALAAAMLSLCAVASMKGLSTRIVGAWAGVATGMSNAI